ncbi:hypothetical protein ACWIG5_11550 [Streptomyces lydicus]
MSEGAPAGAAGAPAIAAAPHTGAAPAAPPCAAPYETTTPAATPGGIR